MAGATASTSTGVILATSTFGNAISHVGISSVAAAVMVHTGATVIDALPHGTHATRMNMSIKQRMSIFPYEVLVGGSMTLLATILYGFILK